MKRLSSVVTLSVFVLTLTLGGPVLAGEGMDEKKKDYDGEKHSMMNGNMHKKHMMKFMKDHDKRDWRDWRGNRHWKKNKWKRDWDRDHDDGRHGKKDKHGRDDHEKDKDDDERSIHKLYKKVKHKLDLSDEQTNQLSDLYFETKLELIDRKADKKKRHVELKRLKHNDDVDQSEVMDKIDELYSAKASLKKSKMGFKMGVKNLLDSDQWKKLKKDRHKRHGDKKHKKKHDREGKSGDKSQGGDE